MNYPCEKQMLTISYTNIKTSFVNFEEEYDTSGYKMLTIWYIPNSPYFSRVSQKSYT